MLLRSACRRAGSTCLPRALLVRPLLTQPAPRRLLCSSGDPKVPKGFGRFAKHKPSGTSAAAEGASKEAAEASKAAEGGAKEAAEGSSSSSSSGGSSGSSSSSGTGGGSSSSSGSGGGPSSSGSSGDGGFGGLGGLGGGGGTPNPSMIFLGVASGLLLAYQLMPQRQDTQEITFSDFRRELLESGTVDRIVIVNKTKARVYVRTHSGPPGARIPQSEAQYWFALGSVSQFEKGLETAQAALGVAPRDYLPVTYDSETSVGTELLKLGPTLLLIGFWLVMMRGAGGLGGMMGGGGSGGGRNIFQVGKSKPTIITKEQKTGVTFKDVAGLAEAKVEVMELVDFLKNPGRYKELGAKIPKGALLTGPPGTGKTLLAKATAGEANVPFLSVSGSDFIEMFVGVGPSRVRDLFAQAKQMQPCIVWIDEIDAIGKARNKSGGMGGGNDERENTLNQLLVEMDGFQTTGNIVVLAGTNRPDTLDSALLRPGRFDRTIEVGNPDISGRAEIFRVHLPKLTLADEVTPLSEKLASLTPGFSGAEIANVCNEGALMAARRQADVVELVDFHAAMDRVIGGLEKRSKVLTTAEKTRVAHHEAGHAVVGWFLQHASPLLKVSIVPRGMAALGYAQYVPKERKLHTKEQMLDTMCMMLGGRIAEALFFSGRDGTPSISTGAQDDLQKVTRIAYSLVTVYGMSDRIGHLSFPTPQDGRINSQRPYSEEIAELVDEEVRQIVNGAYDRTYALLSEKKELAKLVAEKLLEKEVIHREDVEAILGSRPWKEATTYEELVAGVGNSVPVEAEVEEAPAPSAPPADRGGVEPGLAAAKGIDS
jgi:AFG3 family protein